VEESIDFLPEVKLRETRLEIFIKPIRPDPLVMDV
jgi:hypothetical protein